ncbi:MAG: 3-hydroxyacyl-[acyl-carrier-protein] dehydratase [Verrucomicrobiales bacterium]
MEPTADQPFLDAALSSLPHGRGFRFLDALDALEPGKTGTARYHIRGDESFIEAHFPGNPMMPGVILIEAIAQLGGVVCQCDPAHAQLGDMRLSAVRNAKIFGAASPGQTLKIEVKIEGRMAGLVQIAGEVYIIAGEQPMRLAQAKVTLSGQQDLVK